jgi:hypothetical protein
MPTRPARWHRFRSDGSGPTWYLAGSGKRAARRKSCALLKGRRYGFEVERAIYLTVLHRLFARGSDRAAERWRQNHLLPGTETLELHHLYRAMAFLGEAQAEP